MSASTTGIDITKGATPLETRQPLHVTHVDDLSRLLRRPTPKSVALTLPSFRHSDAEYWQSEINRQLHTCGCSEAAAFFLIMTCALTTATFMFWNVIKSAPTLSLTTGLCCMGLSIAIGKALGQWRGRRRLAQSVQRLRAAATRQERRSV